MHQWSSKGRPYPGLLFFQTAIVNANTYSPALFDKPGNETPEGFLLVKGGTFWMGDEFEDLWAGCRPLHQVTLTYDFWMKEKEVAFFEYDDFCDDTGRTKPSDEGWGRGRRPVINVTWWDAIAYCNWLSEKEDLRVAYRLQGEPDEGQMLDANGNVTPDITQVVGYRLPTEAEWEYAARSGTNSPAHKYSGSSNVNEVAWYLGNSGGKSWPTGTKNPNALELYDMSGNVFEWCIDWWYNYISDYMEDPVNTAPGNERIVRGGSWDNSALEVRVAHRISCLPTYADYRLGFRIVRTAH